MQVDIYGCHVLVTLSVNIRGLLDNKTFIFALVLRATHAHLAYILTESLCSGGNEGDAGLIDE